MGKFILTAGVGVLALGCIALGVVLIIVAIPPRGSHVR